LIDKLEIQIPGGLLTLEKLYGNAVRVRKIVKGVESSKIVSTPPAFQVDLKAIPPLAGPLNTTCLYIALSEPIVLPGGSILEYNLRVPVDLGVFIGDVLVDVVGLWGE